MLKFPSGHELSTSAQGGDQETLGLTFIISDAGSNYNVSVREIPGVVTTGESEVEALLHMLGALPLHLQGVDSPEDMAE